MRISDWSSDVCSSDLTVVARTVRCHSNHTRPMSWLGPALSGAHPRTKGARCFTGGHRHRLPLTPKGLLVPRRVTRRHSTRRPIGADGTITEDRKSVVEGKSVAVR